MSYLFLFREKDSDDRDCCAYIDSKNPRFECNHYFGSVNLNGACYSGHKFPAYEDIETVLTKAEYNELVQFNKAINDLGYGITKGDERYNKGIALAKSVQHIYDKLKSEEAKEFPAMTIHRTLGCQGLNDFTYNKDNHLITDVAFLDEGSMVNASLFLHWLEAIGDNTRIIISGDHKQLPPIGFGNVFSDLIEMFDESVVSKLVKPMRQAEKSGILVDANKIRENINPISEKLQPRIIHGELQDMYYMFRTNRQSLFNIAVKTFIKSVESDGIDNVVIAVPRRKDCLNSTNEINKVIQNELLGDVLESIEGFDTTFKLGAKVMQTVNDYDKNVFNGEIGYVTKISERYDGKKKEEYCEVTYTDIFGKDKIIEYTKKELAALDLAYAMTVHKLQGAGRKTVIGIIDNTHHQLLDNCMLYTLLTRAKKRCLLLAEPEAFLQCIRTSHNNRNTWMMLETENNTVEG